MFSRQPLTGLFFVLSLVLAVACSDGGKADQPKLNFKPFYSAKKFQPCHITHANDGSHRLFVTDLSGKIYIFKNDSLTPRPFLDLSKYLDKGEMLLLSLAFSPTYVNDGIFYTYYTDLLGTVYLSRFQVSAEDPDSAVVASGKLLYSATSNTGRVHHHGGDLHFGKDGYLYLTIGYMDKQKDPNRQAQNMDLPFGKLLRLDVNVSEPPYYKIPSDNPYLDRKDTLPEIWATGLRNPWRFSFDKATGDLWIGDVGQNKYEEINYLPFQSPGGANFGWSCYEADSSFDTQACSGNGDYVFPIFSYEHNYKTGNSITGGNVYRGTKFPSIYGFYLCADFASKEAWLIKKENNNLITYHQSSGVPSAIIGFGEDESGELYATTYNGKIYKIEVENERSAEIASRTTTNGY